VGVSAWCLELTIKQRQRQRQRQRPLSECEYFFISPKQRFI
jgi:hypothetical protein